MSGTVERAPLVPAPGMIVVFEDTALVGGGALMVASYIPGAVDRSGEPVHFAWVDSYGGRFTQEEIEAGGYKILYPEHLARPAGD